MKQVDLIVNGGNVCAMYNPSSHIVYAANASNVMAVVVKDKVLVQDSKLMNCDREAIYGAAKKSRIELKHFQAIK